MKSVVRIQGQGKVKEVRLRRLASLPALVERWCCMNIDSFSAPPRSRPSGTALFVPTVNQLRNDANLCMIATSSPAVGDGKIIPASAVQTIFAKVVRLGKAIVLTGHCRRLTATSWNGTSN